MVQPNITSTEVPLQRQRAGRKAFVGTFIGTALEWFDFFLYGAAAALILGPQFFPTGDPVVGQLAAFGTFAAGFLTRPIGGVLAGHFGDRVGRKRMLVLSLVTMGVVMVLVGLLPTYEQIGVAAPIALVVLRLIQGLAVGAEWGGAAVLAVEHAPEGRKTLYGSAPQLGVPVGAIMANLALLGLAELTGPSFTTWGWRVAFLFSIVLVAVGVYLRRSLAESPDFDTAARTRQVRAPLVEVCRRYPLTVLLAMLSTLGGVAVGYIALTFILSYGPTRVGYSTTELLSVMTVTSLFHVPLMLAGCAAADRWGLSRVMVLGSLFQIAAVLVFFPLFDTGLILAAGVALLLCKIATAGTYAPLPAFLAGLFPTRVRYTGISLAYQFGSIVGGSLAPIVATVIVASTGNSLLIGVYLAALTVVSAVAIGVSNLPAVARRLAAAEEGLDRPEPTRTL